MRRLSVWDGDAKVGSFTERDGAISFSYANDSSPLLSLSLPKGEVACGDAPRNFLRNLLPERSSALLSMREALGVDGTDPFDLLDAVDTAGGYSYTLSGEPPAFSTVPLRPLNAFDIEARIADCSLSGAVEPVHGMRFSLAGYQGKFTMSLIDGRWFEPSSRVPSTHILKPPSTRVPSVCECELAAMDLAAACGIPCSRHGIIEAGESRAYCVERFDRDGVGTAACCRVHVEDFAQALGMAPEEKYDATLEDVVRLLLSVDPSAKLCHEWLRQYMFNAYAGNADGHLKNYSLIYRGADVELAPLYDAVVTSAWPQFDPGLGISVNDMVFFPKYLTESVWVQVARHAGLDTGRVVDSARKIARDVLEFMPEHLGALPAEMRDRALGACREAVSGVLDSSHVLDASMASVYDDVS